MLVNTFQFLYKYLSQTTLVRLYHCYYHTCFKRFIKQKVGYTTIYMYPLLKNNNKQKLIVFRNSLRFYIDDDHITISQSGNSVSFLSMIHGDHIELIAMRVVIKDRHNFKKMMTLLKEVFDDFHMEKCKITHSKDIVVTLKVDNGQFIEIPPYINLTIFEDNTLPIYLNDLVT